MALVIDFPAAGRATNKSWAPIRSLKKNTKIQILELIFLNTRFTGSQQPGLRTKETHFMTRDGRYQKFALPEEIQARLEKSLLEWNQALFCAQDVYAVASAAAKLWIQFLAIRPFDEHNESTAKEFLKSEFNDSGFVVSNFELLDQYLMQGYLEQDPSFLTTVFIATLSIKS